jgi:esterase/lipase superfamily enzyme
MGLYRSSEQLDRSARDCYHLNFTFHLGEEPKKWGAMHTEVHKWYSPSLGKDMEFKVYGHYGKTFIVFPCSRGRYFDFEGQGMIDKISSYIDGGKIKLYAIDSVDAESWYNFGISTTERNARHNQYDKYVTDEVIPFIRKHSNSPNERPMATGTSMGAYHAVNFF